MAGPPVAEATIILSMEAAAFVDAQVSAFAHKVGIAQLERLVEEAKARFMPEQTQADAEKAADGRNVTFHHDQLTFNGTTHVEGELDLADALDLDAALAQGAEQLKACGSEESFDVRRAMAAGELARHQLALDLTSADADAGEATKTPQARQVVLYVHLSEEAVSGTSTGLDLARVENHRLAVTADQVRGWCANPDTRVVVKPVIDLNEHIATNAYEVPKRLEEQTRLRDQTCVFPWCTRPAARCDNEHCLAHAKGGTTCSCNIAPMCRRHHRLKTHSSWTYTTLEPGSFLWTSPHDYQFLRDETGTLDVSRDRPERGTHWDDPPPPVPQHFY